ncbi:hypothetical protein [Hymenobacter cavernae]|uniref:PH domain-containing protein n=1 Tax=Hymenobacter cavernae TaxID=2044852 RepID=A0ABQ1TJ56_9BACT|nr:hypothetical protein [Hymenobacter cavernae]GGE95125.1 hypothetical protein GCM10011383_02290 [Hymenobacter cavernae]
MPPAFTRIRLQPANTARIPFWGQLFIGTLWILYTIFLIWSDSGLNDYHFLHYLFLIFSFVYVGYVLVHNAPIFGTQSYLEFTPGYIVHKSGLFRAKQVFPVEEIGLLEFVPQQLRVSLKNGEMYALSLREVKGSRRKRILREQVRSFASKNNIPLHDNLPPV